MWDYTCNIDKCSLQIFLYVTNHCVVLGEDKFLQQLAIEEQFGVTIEEKETQKEKLHEKKGTGAAIAYNYSDPGAQSSASNGRFSFTIQSTVMFESYLCLVTR